MDRVLPRLRENQREQSRVSLRTNLKSTSIATSSMRNRWYAELASSHLLRQGYGHKVVYTEVLRYEIRTSGNVGTLPSSSDNCCICLFVRLVAKVARAAYSCFDTWVTFMTLWRRLSENWKVATHCRYIVAHGPGIELLTKLIINWNTFWHPFILNFPWNGTVMGTMEAEKCQEAEK